MGFCDWLPSDRPESVRRPFLETEALTTSAATHALRISCPDRIGIVAAVSTTLARLECNIEDSNQFSDQASGTFFMRVTANVPPDRLDDLNAAVSEIAARFEMDWSLHDLAAKPRILVLVSRFDHCLNDLLYRASIGALPAEIAAIGSNHETARRLAEVYDVPFHHLPVTPDTRAAQERQLLDLIKGTSAELVVLARYMQILSPELCTQLRGRAINIHHSFLPSFVGARPYQRAFDHGVKIIGATAHYVTPELDEGPIIEQDVARVDHALRVKDLIALGRDIEAQVLARAVKLHVEHRIFLNGRRTVVFR